MQDCGGRRVTEWGPHVECCRPTEDNRDQEAAQGQGFTVRGSSTEILETVAKTTAEKVEEHGVRKPDESRADPNWPPRHRSWVGGSHRDASLEICPSR